MDGNNLKPKDFQLDPFCQSILNKEICKSILNTEKQLLFKPYDMSLNKVARMFIDKDKEEDKNMSNQNKILTEGIIEKWLKMNFREIDKCFDENKTKAKDNDCNAKTIKSHIADIIEIMCCNRDMTSAEKELYASRSFDYIESLVGEENLYSKDTLENIESLTHDYGVMKRKCNDIYNEVKVMCEPCETYEQEMAVLKAYNIVDERGRIDV